MIVPLESLVPTTAPHASTTYADWAAAHDPAAAGAARELVDGMRTELGRTWTRDTPTGVPAYAADGTLLWEQDGHHSPRHPMTARPRRVARSGGTALPPAFWYLLRTRDPSGSRALRTLRRETADTLLTTARTDPATLRTTVARELPEITEPPLAEAVAAIAERAARVEDRRLELHRRATRPI
ncbi:hypothetical protein [Streptomyces sp. NPDC003435]